MQPVLHRSQIVNQDPDASGSGSLELLAHACGVAREGKAYRLIEFVAARGGEGTSTVAQEFALSLARLTGLSVLLVDASVQQGPDRLGLVEALVADLPVERAAVPLSGGVHVAKLSGIARVNGELIRRIGDRGLWAAVTAHFDAVVVDAPALERSNRGITLAELMDAVVVVVEAEATRGPVVKRLIDLLRRAEAPVIGTVLNKRRYYIPKVVYDRL